VGAKPLERGFIMRGRGRGRRPWWNDYATGPREEIPNIGSGRFAEEDERVAAGNAAEE